MKLAILRKTQILLGTILSFTFAINASAQTINPLVIDYVISGPASVIETNRYTYTVSPSKPSNYTWFIGSGSASSATNSSVDVTWFPDVTSGFVKIKDNTGVVVATLNVTISPIPPLTGGSLTISPTTANLLYGTAPAQLTASVATGGNCGGSYAYQWQSSPDNSTFTNISTATGQNYQPPSLTSTTYYRRAVSCNGVTAYTNVYTANVYPQLLGGTLSPATQDTFVSVQPATISGTAASGGGCSGSYTYKWYSSTDGTNFTGPISGATSASYTPGPLTTSTYFRRVATCSTQTANSNDVQVIVHPHLSAGTASPSNVTIAYNGDPGTLTATTSSGGITSSYAYQWQQSTDNVNWTNTGTAGSLTLSPGNLTSATYYRLKTVNRSETVYTNTISVHFPPLVSGNTWPTYQLANSYTNMPINLKCGLASGGACPGEGCYAYQWQQSANGTSWSDITGAILLTYNPGYFNPATKTYYRMKISVGGETAYSIIDTIDTEISRLAGPTDCWVGQTALYHYNTGNSSIYNWSATSGGTVVGGASHVPEAYIHWTGIGQQTVTLDSGGVFVTLKVNVHNSPLSPGIIGKPYQTLENGSSITIDSSPDSATGGTCGGSFTYQWQKSTDSIHYLPISGQTSRSIVDPTTISGYYRRKVICGSDSAFTDTSYVLVFPYFNPGTISLSNTDSIGWNTVPAVMTGSLPTGGLDSVYTYQWEYSLNNLDFYPLTNSGTGIDFQPTDPLATSVFYRRKATNAVTSRYSNTLQVLVKIVHFDPGTISPNTLVINSGQSVSLSGTQANGGTVASYSYQWQQSDDEVNWKNISGGTSQNYSSSALSRTTYYRRYVTNGPQNGYSFVSGFLNVVRVKVRPGSTGTNLPTTTTQSVADPGITPASIAPVTLLSISNSKINFIRSWDVNKNAINTVSAAKALTSPSDAMQSTTYFDDLGRDVQTVAKQANPSSADLITVKNYDILGRVAQQYLPYTDSASSGNFRTDANSRQPGFYNSLFNNKEGFYYSNSIYEASPENRIIKATAPGNSWTGNNIGARTDYTFNGDLDSVRIWTIGNLISDIPQTSSSYVAGALAEIITTDEHDNKVIEFKDKDGKTILKKVQLSDTLFNGYSGWLATYYVYDNLDRLRYVIPPKAVQYANQNAWTLSAGVGDELCFSYNYDQEGRLITKKVPGAGVVEMVYDARDRMVMSRDSVLRQNSQWLVSTFDSLNRTISTTLWNNGSDRATHQTSSQSSISYPTLSGTYSILTESFYDDQNWQSRSDININHSFTTAFNNTNDLPVILSGAYTQTPSSSAQTRGMQTGSRIKVLDPLNNNLYELGINFYDEFNRPIQQQSLNLTGAWDTTTTQYDFAGKALSTCATHSIISSVAPVKYNKLVTAFNYDAQGRVTTVNKYLNGSTSPEAIATNTYDVLGRLKNKSLGNQPVESLAYDYNIRGWLKGINRDYVTGVSTSNFFGMDLAYDFGFTLNQLNGNIAGTAWKSRGNPIGRAYGFGYDNTNRILKADYTQNSGGGYATDANVNFSVDSLSYDANGNILSMNQKGLLLNTSAYIDRLTYSYQGSGAWTNKLAKVADASGITAPLGDFKDGLNSGDDYVYDGNGNLVLDNNKKISNISYNFLNLPQQISINGKGTINYVYDAAGNKLKKIVVDSTSGVKTTTTSYTGAYIYDNDTLQIILHEEGRLRYVLAQGTNPVHYSWDYFIKDHLGNVRMVLTEESQTDKYPALTMETVNRATEQLYYNPNPLSSIQGAKPNGYDSDTSNHYMVKLNYSDPARRIGPSILLKVMATDTVDMKTNVFYQASTQNNSNSHIVSEMVAGLIVAFGGTSTALDPSGHFSIGDRNLATFNTSGYPNIDDLKNTDPNQNAGKPKAYLNWILFDEQFNLVNSSSGTRQISSSADTKDSLIELGHVMGTNGYLYVYLSNESPMDVYFENFQVNHHRGKLLEENHYYPFGLSIAGISAKSLVFGKSRILLGFNNGNELQSNEFSDGSGFDMYDAKFRSYDPQIGRFVQIDRLADIINSISAYSFANNNPIRFNDPLGLKATDTITLSPIVIKVPKKGSPTDVLNRANYETISAWVDFELARQHSPDAIRRWAFQNKLLSDNARKQLNNATSAEAIRYRRKMSGYWKSDAHLYKTFLIIALSEVGGELLDVAIEGEEVNSVSEEELATGAADATIGSAEDLMGQLEDLKFEEGMLKHGEVHGEATADYAALETQVSQNATEVGQSLYKLSDGTFVKFYKSFANGESIQINTGDVIYKLRINP
ncbi:MAG: hypothetical protein C5B52_05120 [Bacteroidetes bacterium]|nr:MAG: hypothetical protein C5B52_05120 [Bacteroidota bacterium]